jgi:MerR-like DNA binding protein
LFFRDPTHKEGGMRAKEAAKAAGFSIDSLKRLEEKGLIPAPRRSRSGQRYYSQEIIEAARAAYFPPDPKVQTLAAKAEADSES